MSIFWQFLRVGTLQWFDEYRDAGKGKIAPLIYILNRFAMGMILMFVFMVMVDIATRNGVSQTLAGISILLIGYSAIAFEIVRMMRLGRPKTNRNADRVNSK